ncbi:MAG: 3-deoxy-8-phosphooctulonate synthase [Desulfobacterales bacterium]|nr:MAG: 3-deoxy-8-phosphooctulonate synthase [Desulfobacterales bacterium]
MGNVLKIGPIAVGPGSPWVLIAGPCVIESYETTYAVAAALRNLTAALEIPFIFKASYDKANRTSIRSYRGPGLEQGLEILGQIKADLDILVLADVHRIDEVAAAAQVLDVIQIPALLCRQTDLILEIARTQKPMNIKKGQFLAPWDMVHVVEKAAAAGNRRIMLTERGTLFGYNNLVVDFRNFSIMRAMGCPIIFDATHSVQLPGGEGLRSGGNREYAPVLARAAMAAGIDGLFMEVHPNPDQALCDGPNSLPLDTLSDLLGQLQAIRKVLAHESP